MMINLPIEVCLTIGSYLETVDQTAWGSCCHEWYNTILRQRLRILQVHSETWSSESKMSDFINKIPRVISNPSLQLEIYVPAHTEVHLLSQLFESINYSMKRLNCSIGVMSDCIARNPNVSFHIQHFNNGPSDGLPVFLGEDVSNMFSHFHGLQKLHFGFTKTDKECWIPDLPTINELEVWGSVDLKSSSFQLVSLSRLYKLSLRSCTIEDVSMFGRIPDLSLEDCPHVTDISRLNHNRRIEVYNCAGIVDYSKSFAYSERIRLFLFGEVLPEFNFHHWQAVKYLIFEAIHLLELAGNAVLPATLLQCQLDNILFTANQITVSDASRMREVALSHIGIPSLTHFGFERLVVIELSFLESLSSLDGIGSGRNQKVIVKGCPLITDYSPLRSVHEVIIEAIYGMVRLDQLDQVHTLTITTMELVMDSNKSYDQIYSLDISEVQSNYALHSLSRIPLLMIGSDSLNSLRSYLVNEGKIYHQRVTIILQVYPGYRHDLLLTLQGQVEELYRQFLSQDYHYLLVERSIILVRR